MKHDPDYGTIWDVAYATAFVAEVRKREKDKTLSRAEVLDLYLGDVERCEDIADAAVELLQKTRADRHEAEAHAAERARIQAMGAPRPTEP